MTDELIRLRQQPRLAELLGHYVRASGDDREVWLARCMQLDHAPVPEMSRLHGELIAHGWIEQNTGVVAPASAGICAACYRTTAAGRRAFEMSLRLVTDHLAEAA